MQLPSHHKGSEQTKKNTSKRDELTQAFMNQSWFLLSATIIFSIFVNLLMLTGPLFMLQIYDRVLSSQSVETLTALVILMTGLFILMGILDFARGRVMARIGARFYTLLASRVDEASLRSPREKGETSRNLVAVEQAISSPAPFVFFDIPWTPIFIALLFLFHFWLGVFAVIGGLIMIAVAFTNRMRSKSVLEHAQKESLAAEILNESLRRERETLQALGMMGAAVRQLSTARNHALEARMVASDRAGAYSATVKTLRFFLQSAILALGALLAIHGKISPGMMIAGSILLGRALAPVEQGTAQWATIQRAIVAWRQLRSFLEANPRHERAIELPTPAARLAVKDVALTLPGIEEPVLSQISFELEPGEALGVVGRNACGKSTLARVLTGIWVPTKGEIRLDGATYDQWNHDVLGSYIGYLPQAIGLFSGTIAQNIARLASDFNSEAILSAAKQAGAHEMIMRLPNGYETMVGAVINSEEDGLSGGQRQRIGLARALYGDPVLIVLDEPNAHLDGEGERGLIETMEELKGREKVIVVMAHRPSAITACDKILLMENGRPRAFGPRDDVLRAHSRANTHSIGTAENNPDNLSARGTP